MRPFDVWSRRASAQRIKSTESIRCWIYIRVERRRLRLRPKDGRNRIPRETKINTDDAAGRTYHHALAVADAGAVDRRRGPSVRAVKKAWETTWSPPAHVRTYVWQYLIVRSLNICTRNVPVRCYGQRNIYISIGLHSIG
jgi:hypothetical protein